MSWSGESCELLIQIQEPSPDWKFGVKCQFILHGSAKTRTVSLLKQIMSPVEWNAEKSKDVIQQYYHWLELISKYEAISSEKITDTVKITPALQNVKGNLAQSLNVSISDSTTWSQVHALLINYFNNAVPVDLKPIYQFDQSEKTEINSFKKGKGKGQKSKGQKGKGSKGSSSFPNPKGKSKGKGKTKSKGKGQWTTWSWGQNQNPNWGQTNAGDIEIKKDGILKDQQHSSKEVQVLSTQRKFTISINTLKINQLRVYLRISSEVFEIYDLKLNNSSIRI